MQLREYADLWLQSKVLNQPIRMTSNLEVEFGYGAFHNSEVVWQKIKGVPGRNEKAKLNSRQERSDGNGRRI